MDNVIMIFQSSIFLLAWTMCPVWSLEEPRQEIYLQPRNFNPHPYQVDDEVSSSAARGPILFPPSPPPDTEGSNFIRVDNTRKSPHPVDNHPYSKLVRKHKYRNPGRHQEFEQKNYAFSYKVVDHLTGDDFSHTQSQNEKATSGEYRVKLPDGRVQIVSYTADKNGYKADVKYQNVDGGVSLTEPQHSNDIPDKGGRIGGFRSTEFNDQDEGKYTFDHRSVGVGVRPTPAVPIHENHIEDYDYGDRNEKVVYATEATPSSQLIFGVTQPSYQAYHQPTVSHQDRFYPSLDYGDAPQTNHHQQQQQVHPHISHRFQIIPHNKIQIVNQGAPTLSSTVAPSYLVNPGIILSTPRPEFSSDYPHVFVKSINGVYGRK